MAHSLHFDFYASNLIMVTCLAQYDHQIIRCSNGLDVFTLRIKSVEFRFGLEGEENAPAERNEKAKREKLY